MSATDQLNDKRTSLLTTLLNRRWAPHVLYLLALRPRRYHELRAVPGTTDRVLTSRLRELEAVGVIERRAVLAPPNGSGVEYRLTDAGRSVVPIFDAVDAFLDTPEAEIFASS